jgi:Xaa-Pro dipeptidase
MDETLAALLRAQDQARRLFDRIEELGLIRAGRTESEISEQIFQLGERELKVAKHWHRRIVRAGPNTRLPFSVNPPDRVVTDDDVVSVDLGPVFGNYEADFGRTWVLGSNREKRRLCDDLSIVFHSCRELYRQRPSMTGAELYAQVLASSEQRGWRFGGTHAGHLIGPFPLLPRQRDAAMNRIRPDNIYPMDDPDSEGRPRYWVLEIHLLDPTGEFGGFYEELLTV